MEKNRTLEIIDKVRELIPGDKDELTNMYKPYITRHSHFTESQHQRYAGKALKLFDHVWKNGGTLEELTEAAKYFAVCFDSMKRQLNVPLYEQKNGINALGEKYGSWKIHKINRKDREA